MCFGLKAPCKKWKKPGDWRISPPLARHFLNGVLLRGEIEKKEDGNPYFLKTSPDGRVEKNNGVII
jgi:hypothetical protein